MMLFLSRKFILLPSYQVLTFSRSTKFTNIRKIVSSFNMTEQISLTSLDYGISHIRRAQVKVGLRLERRYSQR